MATIRIDGREYEIPERLKFSEARLLQQIGGLGLGQLTEALQSGDANVIAALVLIIMRRQDSSFTIQQVDEMYIDQINFGPDEPVTEEETNPPQTPVSEQETTVVPADGETQQQPASNLATTPPSSGAQSSHESMVSGHAI